MHKVDKRRRGVVEEREEAAVAKQETGPSATLEFPGSSPPASRVKMQHTRV